MYVDSHVHLQPHGQQPPVTRERIELYVQAAQERGVERLAFTEHLFRFQEAFDALSGWWDDDATDPALSAATQQYWQHHVPLRVAYYVRAIAEAKSSGLALLPGPAAD